MSLSHPALIFVYCLDIVERFLDLNMYEIFAIGGYSTNN